MATKKDYSRLLADLQKVRGETPPSGSVPPQGTTGSSGDLYEDYKRRNNMSFLTGPRAQPSATPVVAPKKSEDKGTGSFLSNLAEGLDFVKNPALTVLSTVGRGVDIPGAAVRSAYKETVDAFDPNKDASWSDFKDQFNRRATSNELNIGLGGALRLDDKGWEDNILGFIDDAITDPFTYLSFGVAPIAKGVGKGLTKGLARGAKLSTPTERSLAAAIKTGQSKIIQKKLIDSAEAAGYKFGDETFGNTAIDNLIVDAGLRGNGALTPQGLARSGVSEKLAAELGVPTLGKTLGVGGTRFAIPGSVRYTSASENLKGLFKYQARTKPAATWARAKGISSVGAQRQLYDLVANETADLGKRLSGAVALRAVNEPLSRVRGFAQDFSRETGMVFKKLKINKFNNANSKVLINNLESGNLIDEASQSIRRLLDKIQSRLVAAGVEVGYLGNYVPHMVTQEAMQLAARNEEVKKFFVDNLFAKEGFQRVRNLEQGKPFFDEILETGSIEEINRIFFEKFGKKMFEDDINVIMPRYIRNASEAMLRSEQIKALSDAGFSRARATEVVRRPLPNDDPIVRSAQKIIKDSERQITQAKRKIVAQRNKATDLRAKNIKSVRGTLSKKRAAIFAERNELADGLQKLQKAATDVTRQLETAEKNLLLGQQSVELWRKRVLAERSKKRSALKANLLAAETRLKDLTVARDAAKKRFDKIMTAPDVPLRIRQKYSGPVADVLRQVEADLAAIEKRLVTLAPNTQKTLDQLLVKNNAPGALSGMAERSLRAADLRLERLTTRKDQLIPAADAAVALYDFALGSTRFADEQLGKAVAELDKFLAETANMPTLAKRQNVSDDMAQIYRDKMVVAREALNDPSMSKEAQLFAKLEAAAAASDLEALAARDSIGVLEQMAKAAKDSKSIAVVETIDSKNMRQISETLDMPDWLLKMYEVEDVYKKIPLYGNWLGKVLSLWKGYAIARPGFHIRNAYSGLFGMYLEAGASSISSVKDWARYMVLVRSTPVEADRMKIAVAKFGQAKAEDLESAWRAVNATGTGQISGELGKETFAGGNYNPFSNTNKLFNLSRGAGERVEDLIRGSHAYDVIRRGGDADMAVDVVNKWQFNYTDLTDFDQKAKMVIPFWVFMSRNIALQSQTWVRSAARVNRSVKNFERNVGAPEDEDVPDWFVKEGAIPYGVTEEGDVKYWFSDLPAVTWPGDLDTYLGTPFSPRKLGETISSFNPMLKGPIEFATGKSLFTGANIPDNEMVPLPSPLRQIANLTDADIPGGFLDRSKDGELMIRRDVLNALLTSAPGLGSFERVVPGTEKGQGNVGSARKSYVAGISTRTNDAASRRSARLSKYFENKDERARQRSLGF